MCMDLRAATAPTKMRDVTSAIDLNTCIRRASWRASVLSWSDTTLSTYDIIKEAYDNSLRRSRDSWFIFHSSLFRECNIGHGKNFCYHSFPWSYCLQAVKLCNTSQNLKMQLDTSHHLMPYKYVEIPHLHQLRCSKCTNTWAKTAVEQTILFPSNDLTSMT